MSVRGGPDIVENGLVLYLDAANRRSYPGSGTTWFDLSGNGNNGTLTNGPTFDSANGGSISFDGVNDYVTTPLTLGDIFASSNGLEQLTMCYWHRRPSAASATSYLGSIQTTTSGTIRYIANYVAIFSGPVTWIIGFEVGGAGVTWGGGAGFGYEANAYGFFCMAVNLKSGEPSYTICSISPTAAVFVNHTGTTVTYYSRDTGDIDSIQTGFFAVSTAYTATDQPFLLGRRATSYYNGRMGSTMIYNRMLTPVEMVQNYNATRSRFGV